MSSRITLAQKIFFVCVLALAAWVGFWGMFRPKQVDTALPFMVPPLHARFLGAMYFSGATAMILGIFARIWPEVRVVMPMIAIWTGLLGIISFLHLEAFNWSRTQTWVWFFAYTVYPITAAWFAWQRRSAKEHPAGVPFSGTLRIYLYIQGIIATALGLGLLLVPAAMPAFWPWKITPLLAHLYSAPFLSYGLGSFYASRQQTWPEVRFVVYATFVFTLLVLVGSLLHTQTFNFGAISTQLWFGLFGLATLALALFGCVPPLRRKS